MILYQRRKVKCVNLSKLANFVRICLVNGRNIRREILSKKGVVPLGRCQTADIAFFILFVVRASRKDKKFCKRKQEVVENAYH